MDTGITICNNLKFVTAAICGRKREKEMLWHNGMELISLINYGN